MKSKKYSVIFILAVILLISLVLRVNPMLEARDYWYDEAFTGVLLKKPWGEMNQMIFDDVHPPLYYWLAKPLAAMFDYSPAGIRSLSVIFGFLTVVSLYWVGKKMFNRKAGLLAASFCALSPFAIQYSQEARMYALFGFLMIWTVWFFYKALKDNSWKYWIWWGVFGGLAFYTHYLALFFFLVFYAIFVFYNKIFLKKSFKNAVFKNVKFWGGTGIIFIFFLTWIKILIGHLSRKGLGWVEKADLSNIPETIQYFFFGHIPGKILMPEPNTFRSFEVSFKGNEFTVGPFFDGSSLGLVVFALMLALFILLWMKNKIRKEMFLLGMISFGTMLLLIVFSWAGLKLYVARYFMPVAVIIYLLLAGMLTTYFKNKNAWFYCLLVYVLLILLMNPIKYDTAWYQFLNSGLVKENEEVVVDNPFSYASAKYYLGEDRVKLYNRYNPKQDFSLWIIIDQEDIITDLDKIKNNPEVNILDDENCDWQGVELKETADFKNLKFCSF